MTTGRADLPSRRACGECHQPTAVGELIGGLCMACFAGGKPMVASPLMSTDEIVRRAARVERPVTPCNEVKHRDGDQGSGVGDQGSATTGEETMAKKECRFCHTPKANLYEHEPICKSNPDRKTNGRRPRGGAESTDLVVIGTHGKKLKRKTAQALVHMGALAHAEVSRQQLALQAMPAEPLFVSQIRKVQGACETLLSVFGG